MSIPPPIPKTPPKTPANRAIIGNMHLFDLPPLFDVKSSTSYTKKMFSDICQFYLLFWQLISVCWFCEIGPLLRHGFQNTGCLEHCH